MKIRGKWPVILTAALVLLAAGSWLGWQKRSVRAPAADDSAAAGVASAARVVYLKGGNLGASPVPGGGAVSLTSAGNVGAFVFSPAADAIYYVRSGGPSGTGGVVKIDLTNHKEAVVSNQQYDWLAVNPQGSILLGGKYTPIGVDLNVIASDYPIAVPHSLPQNVADLAWAPDGHSFIYIHGQTDVSLRSLYWFDPVSGEGKTIVSNPGGRVGVTAASWSPDGRRIAMGVSHWAGTPNESARNGIYLYDTKSGVTSVQLRTPGQSVYLLHWTKDGDLVYATGQGYPPPPGPSGTYEFWRLDRGAAQPVHLFTLTVDDNGPLAFSWVSGDRSLLFNRAGEIWSVTPAAGAEAAPVAGTAGASSFSGGGDEGDLTTVLMVNPVNTRFRAVQAPAPGAAGQNPVSPAPAALRVHVSLSGDGSTVTGGQSGLTELVSRLPWGDFVILPDRVVAGEYFPLSQPLASLAALNSRAATGTFPGDAVTAQHAIPGGEPAGTNLVPIQGTNVFLWVPALDVGGKLPAGHYLLYVGRSYDDPVAGGFRWLTLPRPVDYLTFLKQALVLVSSGK